MQKTFKQFISEESIVLTEATMKASGAEAERHVGKYLQPGQMKTLKYKLAKDSGGGKAGEEVSVKKVEAVKTMDGGTKYNAHIVHSGGKGVVPINHLHKPITKQNRGFEQEGLLAKRLSEHGLMEGAGAGFTGGNDFHLIDKRGATTKKIRGTEGHSTKEIQGEHKSDIRTTAFGQLTLTRHPKTGKWHISDDARARRPEYAEHIEKASITVDGKKRSLIDHLNKTEPAGTVNKSGFYSNDTDTSPAHAYMRDHHVDVIHIDSHGTYRAGNSELKDKHKLGLPVLHGEGRFRVRQKTENPNARTVQFSIRKLEKSNVHLGNDTDIQALKQKLGHTK